MKFQALIFDLDGTLVDSYPAIQESLNYVLKSFGLAELDLETVKRMVGRGLENLMLDSVGEMRKEQGIALFRQSYDETVLRGTFLLPEVIETLRILKDRGLRMAVASNKPSDYSKNILDHFKLTPFFDACYGPDIVKHIKPNPAMLDGLMDLLKTGKEDSLYVGDMIIDVETARNAGVKVALIPTGGNSADELRAAQPDYFLERFSDLVNII